ncbi:MAG: SUF system Fe-S cluster assembly regulator [Pseudomonadota bacterium]
MFRLNRLTDYAVVVLSQMATRQAKVHKAPELAQDTLLPLPTVAKILNALCKADLVVSHRGATGGYSLSREASEISVSDIIQALEGPIALTACVHGANETCEAESHCPLNGHWNQVNQTIQQALEKVSLAELAVASLPAPKAPSEGQALRASSA